MHSLKISACAALLVLGAPIVAAHPPKHRNVHARAAGMKCSDMHARMHGGRRTKAHHARSDSADPGMMHGGMSMSVQPPKAPPAHATQAPSTPAHNHDHAGTPPPK